MQVILSFLIIVAIAVFSLALILGVALGIGWVLTLLLPFSLFEATLLGLIASVVVGTFWNNILNIVPPFDTTLYDTDFDEDDDDEYNIIPETRFYKNQAHKNWENWMRYSIANRVYMEFQDWPQTVSMMKDQQQQELAIRLTDITLSLLKTKTTRTKQLRVTMSTIKREMSKLKQRPYDNDILGLAIPAINEELDYHYQDIIMIINEKLWDKPCPLFD